MIDRRREVCQLYQVEFRAETLFEWEWLENDVLALLAVGFKALGLCLLVLRVVLASLVRSASVLIEEGAQ